MDRRAFIALIGGNIVAAPLVVEARQAEKVYRIGVLAVSAAAFAPRIEAFRRGFASTDM